MDADGSEKMAVDSANEPAAAEAVESTEQSEKEPLVNEAMLAELVEMGFPQNKATRGLYYGGQNLDAAITWMTEHEGDPDIHDPLPADAVPAAKRVLTEEEKQAQAQALKDRIVENRRIQAEQERLNEKSRELERIQKGKEMAESRKKLEEQERLRAIALRKKEKEEELKERERLRQLLRDDRIRRFGVEKANELEEKDRKKAEEAAKKKAEMAAEEKALKEKETSNLKDLPQGAIDYDTSMRKMKVAMEILETNPAATRKVCLETMRLYVNNVVTNPKEGKFRKIRLANAAFQKRVMVAKGGIEFLEAVGFSKAVDPEFLILSHSDMIFMNRVRGDIELALSSA